MSKIDEYIQNLISLDNPQLHHIFEQEKSINDVQPSVGTDVGKMLGFFARLMNAQKVLEFGTCLGYSTIWLGEAMKETS